MGKLRQAMNLTQPKLLRFLFDELHSESWSVSAVRAQEMQPEDPSNASYCQAAEALAARDFEVVRNLDAPLEPELLSTVDLVALVHPCDPKWEHTTSTGSPSLSTRELESLLEFVAGGGGLLVVAEYEHDKYNNNLNTLLAHFGLTVLNGKVFDRAHCLHQNPEWIFGQPCVGSPLAHATERACFYRTGWCAPVETTDPKAGPVQIHWTTSMDAHPRQAGLVATACYGQGRVALVTDSNLFGDERLGHFDHLQLWLNMAYWLAAPRLQHVHPVKPSANSGNASDLVHATNQLRALQLTAADGSVPAAHHQAAKAWVQEITGQLQCLKALNPHQACYLEATQSDLVLWMQGGFGKPDFGNSLAAFHPERHRVDGIEHWAFFPMYTPNASSQVRFEALRIRTPWPKWLADLEHTRYRNPKFVPGHLVEFTEGYNSDCAVLFPETVSLAQKPTNAFGMIFCDREATRLQECVNSARTMLGLELHPELEAWLGCRHLVLDTMALWDLIHDASHSLGELPFDPFMIRQRAPFWMYGLEELRVDLRSFIQATQLAREGFHFARYVCWAMVLDRILRFPITGTRARNYDALGGQLLFAYLHKHDAVQWCDNRLTIRWEALYANIDALRTELTNLYKMGANCSKVGFWIAAHDLISRYLRPNVASQWKADTRKLSDESDPKPWINAVHPDEFPLGSFHLNLQRKLRTAGSALVTRG